LHSYELPYRTTVIWLTSDLKLALEVASTGGDIISKGFHEPKSITSKSNAIDLVTETDKACEKAVISAIQARYPSHKFVAEESYHGDG